MVDYIIVEPAFSDSPQRCFKLPFVATEALTTDNDVIQNAIFGESKVLTKLFSFVTQANGKKLNATLGGYFNKIISFWLIKHPDQILNFVIKQKNIISSMFSHLYLT